MAPLIRAFPLYSHDAVMQWEDARIKSDVPEAYRIYVLWPSGIGISGGPYGSPILVPSTACHIILFKPGMTTGDVFRQVPADPKKVLGVNVYRAGAKPDDKPVFTAWRGNWSMGSFALRPHDVVHLFYRHQPLMPNN